MSVQAVSAFEVFSGIVFMLASISLSLRTKRSVPDELKGRWAVMTWLMLSFLLGYAASLAILARLIDFPLELLTGSVFLGGSLFVYLVIHLSRSIIGRLRQGQEQVKEANDALAKKNELLEKEIAISGSAQEALQRGADELETRVAERTWALTETLEALQAEAAERKKAEEAIRASHAELEQIFNTAANGMQVVDKDHNVLRVNEAFGRLVGRREEALVGKKCYETFNVSRCHTADCTLKRILGGEERIEIEVEKEGEDGEKLHCLVTATPHRDPEGRLVGIIKDFRDVSERKKMEAKLERMTITDELTGLLNRRGFMNLAAGQVRLAERNGCEIYLLYADLDDLKWINDKLGHETGDRAIKEAAAVMRDTFRKADILGRIGGDEFAILLAGSGAVGGDPELVIDRLEETIEKVNGRKGRRYRLSVSAGIVRCDSLPDCTIEGLMAQADASMYENKRRKKALRAS